MTSKEWPFPAPRFMHWRDKPGCALALTAKFVSKSGKTVERAVGADRDRAVVLMRQFLKELIRDGLLDRQSKVAKLYLHKTVTEAELAPTYMFWRPSRSVWRSKIPLNNGKELQRLLGKDRDSAVARMVAIVQALVAEGLLDSDSAPAKLYLHRAVTEVDPKVLDPDQGPRSRKAPPLMRWMRGSFMVDDGPFHRRVRGPILWTQIRLLNGKPPLQISLNTNDPKLAARRLRPHVLQLLAEGSLDPNSKAARIYGGAEDLAIAVDAPKIARAKRSAGRKPKWINGDGAVHPDARTYFEVVTAARVPGGPINAAIKKSWDAIPASQKMSSFGQPLDIRTLTNRYLDLERALMGNSGQ